MTQDEINAAIEEFFGRTRKELRTLLDAVEAAEARRKSCQEMRVRVLGAVLASLFTAVALFIAQVLLKAVLQQG